VSEAFARMWRSLEPIGREATGGYVRYSWTDADREGRAWFVDRARERDLTVETDRNGNLWAWWGDPLAPGAGAVVTGSHLDSVPQGGGYDGPLGIVSALLAMDALRERGFAPARPIGVVAFTEEEGARFGMACLGSRLLCGSITADRARALVDRDGLSLPAAMAAAGIGTDLGAEPDRLTRIAAYVELHIEQGRHLADRAAPIGVASGIWPHGRWRLTITGEGNHAGTTRMSDRRDPMRTLAAAVLATVSENEDTRAGIHRVDVTPNATNAIPSRVTAWLDARAADASDLDKFVATILARTEEAAARDGTVVTLDRESVSPAVTFDPALRERMSLALDGPPVLATAAGHDAGVLASAGVPSGMLFVRNPGGVSHAPAESATAEDCAAGVAALATVLADLTAP